MDKRYQVFISSTFRDLLEERQAVIKAVLELDHMPAGMELFPAGEDDAWQLIKDVIDASDYYVLIVGGRYGSLDRYGIGYTEKEYDYAIATNKPVIPLLHKTPDNLPRDKTETDNETWEKLKAFRKKVEGKHTCTYWLSAEELKSQVVLGLTSTLKRHPAVGWIRADQVPSGATVSEVLKLREKLTLLEKELESRRTQPPESARDLSQGDETFLFDIKFKERDSNFPYNKIQHQINLSISWNEIFAAVAPTLINEAGEIRVKGSLRDFFKLKAKQQIDSNKKLKGKELLDFVTDDTHIDTCLVQFRALGLINVSEKQRSVKDTITYWALTPYGDFLMTQLRALRRTQST